MIIRMRRQKWKGNRGFLFITSLLVLSMLLVITEAGLARSMTELRAANRFISSQQSFHLADAGVDRALQLVLTNRDGEFTDPLFNGHVNNDPNQDFKNYAIPAAGVTLHITREAHVFNPFRTVGTGPEKRFSMANEQRFQVESTAPIAGGGKRTIQAVIGRIQELWVGAAALEHVMLMENTDSPGWNMWPVYPDDETNIFGDLRTNWGAVRTYDNQPGANARSVHVPPGAHVHGNVIVGSPTEDPPNYPAGDWISYVNVAPSPPPSSSGLDAVWISDTASHTIAPEWEPFDVYDLDRLDKRWEIWTGSTANTPVWTQPSYPRGSTYTLPAGTIDGQITAADAAEAITVTAQQLAPPAVDDLGHSCANPPDYDFTPWQQVNWQSNRVMAAYSEGMPIPSVSVEEGGILCYHSYWIGGGSTVYYKKPTTIYITGDVLAIFDKAAVGMASDPNVTPLFGQPSNFIEGAVTFRSATPGIVSMSPGTQVHGTVVAPQKNLQITHLSDIGFTPVRNNQIGSIVTKSMKIFPGVDLQIVPPAGGLGSPTVFLVSWREVSQ